MTLEEILFGSIFLYIETTNYMNSTFSSQLTSAMLVEKKLVNAETPYRNRNLIVVTLMQPTGAITKRFSAKSISKSKDVAGRS